MLLGPRLRFIVKEGMLQRGSVVGAIASIVLAVDSLVRGAAQTSWHSALLVVLCFIEWTIGAGWFIGAWLWSRDQRRRSNR